MADLDAEQNARVRDRLRAWLREGDRSQAELARAIGITPASLSRFLSGGGVSYPTARRVAKVFNIKLDELLGPPSQVEPFTDVHPNRARAVVLARQAEADERAIERVCELELAGLIDKPVAWWLMSILEEHRRLLDVTSPPPDAVRDVRIAKKIQTIVKDAERDIKALGASAPLNKQRVKKTNG